MSDTVFKIGDKIKVKPDKFGGATGVFLKRHGVDRVYTILGIKNTKDETLFMLDAEIDGAPISAISTRFEAAYQPFMDGGAEYEDIIAGDKIYKELT
jgi:hypothetical protein